MEAEVGGQSFMVDDGHAPREQDDGERAADAGGNQEGGEQSRKEQPECQQGDEGADSKAQGIASIGGGVVSRCVGGSAL